MHEVNVAIDADCCLGREWYVHEPLSTIRERVPWSLESEGGTIERDEGTKGRRDVTTLPKSQGRRRRQNEARNEGG